MLVPSPRSRSFPWRPWLDVAAIGSWGALLLTYWRTGKLALLVHPIYNGLVIAAGMLLLIASAFAALKQIRGHSTRLQNPEEHLTLLPPPLTSGILLTAALLGLLISPKPLASAKAMQQQTSASVTVTRSNPQSFRANQDPSERSLVEWVRLLNVYPEPDAYNGQPMEISGFVLPSTPEDNLPTGYIWLARFTITCCAADAYPLQIPVQLPEGAPQTYEADTWLAVEGEAATATLGRDRRLAVQAAQIRPIDPPANPYEY
ncbi:MAG: TIGR03943 family protein [Cyanobacteria bacterium P01_H01_bin.130]